MFRLYSKGCQYAIRALSQAVPAEGEGPLSASALCARAGIPESSTRKILQVLAHGGVLEAIRGPGGGYVMKETPEKVSLLTIVEAVDGSDTFAHCVMGLPECSEAAPCPLHSVWSKAKEDLLARLDSKSLQDLIDALDNRASVTEEVKGNGAEKSAPNLQ